MADHGGGGIPQNESEAVEYLKKKGFLALSEVSFLKLYKTVTEYEFITNYSTKLIMNETKLPRVRSASYQRSKHWRSLWGSTLYHIKSFLFPEVVMYHLSSKMHV